MCIENVKNETVILLVANLFSFGKFEQIEWLLTPLLSKKAVLISDTIFTSFYPIFTAIRKAQNLPEPAVSEFASNSPPEVEAYQPEMQSADSSPQTLQTEQPSNSGAMSYEKLRENRRIADRLSQPQKYQPLQPNWSEQGGDIPPQQPLRVPPPQPEATSDFRIERSQPQRSAKTNKYGDEGFEWKDTTKTQCGYLRIFRLLRFYVKSTLRDALPQSFGIEAVLFSIIDFT